MSSGEVPSEFLPHGNPDEDDNESINIFAESEDENDLSSSTEEVSIGEFTFRLKTPPDVGTLFAHKVWSGSKLLGDFLASHATTYCTYKRTIEFGAGTALPSLVAAAFHSKLTVITDYPDASVLQCLRETVGYNWEACQRPTGRIAVVGHEWGTSIDDISKVFQQPDNDADTIESTFDVAFLSECLWLHRCHSALIHSLDRLLHPVTGKAIVTYAHHVPGMEAADDAFFELAAISGLDITERSEHEMEYMWDSDKRITVYLRVLSRVLSPATSTADEAL